MIMKKLPMCEPGTSTVAPQNINEDDDESVRDCIEDIDRILISSHSLGYCDIRFSIDNSINLVSCWTIKQIV
jgi:hypothetical protein